MKDEATGKYLPKFNIIENGKINETVIHERRRMSSTDVMELGQILTAPAVDDGIRATCFQPRNAVFVHKSGHVSCLDVCFECYGAAFYGDLGSDIIFDDAKYQKLREFFIKHNITFMVE